MSIETIVPGVYIEEDATPALSVSQGATAVPLFVGDFTALGTNTSTTGKLVRITGWLDFAQLFAVNSAGYSASATIAPKAAGTPAEAETETESSATATATDATVEYDISDAKTVNASATLALQLYFQNGGNPCYVYAYTTASQASTNATTTDATTTDTSTTDTATTDTATTDTTTTDTTPVATAAGTASLDVLPALIEEKDDITLLVALGDDAYRSGVYQAVFSTLGQSKGYFLIADSDDGTVPTSVNGSSHVGVYYPALTVTAGKLNEGEVTITDNTDAANPVTKTLAEVRQSNAALATQIVSSLSSYIPTTIDIPASAAVAGIYCKTDRERGVWKAPANVVLNGVSDVTVRVSDDNQGTMNELGVNVIRYFSDRGVVVWGSRTLQNDDNWRYIPVRRLFDTAERDIKKAMRPVVFEPNSAPTWSRVWAAIDTYLYGIWQKGGLAGNSAEEAYFVRIGKGVTMTEADINQGKMIVQVGMAAVRPAEFIILQFTQNMAQ